jgi:hypothetical protein
MWGRRRNKCATPLRTWTKRWGGVYSVFARLLGGNGLCPRIANCQGLTGAGLPHFAAERGNRARYLAKAPARVAPIRVVAVAPTLRFDLPPHLTARFWEVSRHVL